MIRHIAFASIGLFVLAGCGEAEKSVEYYKTHLDEARELSARCRHNAEAGANCGNAATAIQQAAREAFKRDQERTREEAETGSWRPTWNGQ